MKRRRERAQLEPQRFAFRLIDRIYAAALRPDQWKDFVGDLSEAFDGAAVLLTLLPAGELPRCHGTGLVEEFHDTHLSFFIKGFPWSSHFAASFVGGFGDGAEIFRGVDLRRTDFYKRWMKPQKLAPIWPIGVTLTGEDGVPVGGLSIFRAAPGEPFSEEDKGLGDLLVPHLERAMAMSNRMSDVEHARLALADVVDRLPTGVILLDPKRRPVVTNASADRIVALNDGFRLWRSGPSVANSRENARLQHLVADALEVRAGHELEAAGFMTVTRPSGKQPFPVMSAPLVAELEQGRPSRAAVALFIANPEAAPIAATEGLECLYSLTHAEAQLVRLLSQGISLDQAAEARGVSINTARSHLRHVFFKTHTRRQGELVQLVLSGVASLHSERRVGPA